MSSTWKTASPSPVGCGLGSGALGRAERDVQHGGSVGDAGDGAVLGEEACGDGAQIVGGGGLVEAAGLDFSGERGGVGLLGVAYLLLLE